MDRFSAQLILQRQLRQRENRQAARAVEAVMDALAAHHRAADEGVDVELWGTLALLSWADVELCEHNELARGRVASELAQSEGAPAPMCEVLARARQAPPDEASALELSLILAEWLGARVEADEALESATLARELELRAGRGDATGDRIDGALVALALEPPAAAALALAAVRALREAKP